MYQALYYWMNYYLSKIKTNKDPAFNGVLLIMVFEACNLISIGRCIYNITHFKSDEQTAILGGAITFIFLTVFNLAYLYSKRNQIFKEVAEYPENKLSLSNNVFWIYVIGSISVISLVLINS